jgi:cobalt/nickel transport system permease protein
MRSLDRVAQTNRWRGRSLAEKLTLSLGLLAVDLSQPPLVTAPVILAALSILALGAARIPFRVWTWGLAVPLGFSATGAIPLLFPWDIAHGLNACAVMLRALAGGACLIFLGLTTPAPVLIQGAQRLKIGQEIADIALLTYRFIFILTEQALAMHHAQTARMGQATARKRIRSVGIVIACLLPRALHHARRLEIGLAARNWQGAFPTLTPPAPISPAGMILAVGVVGSCLAWGMTI